MVLFVAIVWLSVQGDAVKKPWRQLMEAVLDLGIAEIGKPSNWMKPDEFSMKQTWSGSFLYPIQVEHEVFASFRRCNPVRQSCHSPIVSPNNDLQWISAPKVQCVRMRPLPRHLIGISGELIGNTHVTLSKITFRVAKHRFHMRWSTIPKNCCIIAIEFTVVGRHLGHDFFAMGIPTNRSSCLLTSGLPDKTGCYLWVILFSNFHKVFIWPYLTNKNNFWSNFDTVLIICMHFGHRSYSIRNTSYFLCQNDGRFVFSSRALWHRSSYHAAGWREAHRWLRKGTCFWWRGKKGGEV